ncbi:hypothetical protein KM043_006094 [Ampulex compressa]|nr:hypothetical protein KM043_006094 [Ampulex compressa]
MRWAQGLRVEDREWWKDRAGAASRSAGTSKIASYRLPGESPGTTVVRGGLPLERRGLEGEARGRGPVLRGERSSRYRRTGPLLENRAKGASLGDNGPVDRPKGREIARRGERERGCGFDALERMPLSREDSRSEEELAAPFARHSSRGIRSPHRVPVAHE